MNIIKNEIFRSKISRYNVYIYSNIYNTIEAAFQLTPPSIVLALNQQYGTGQYGRSWVSSGNNMLLSIYEHTWIPVHISNAVLLNVTLSTLQEYSPMYNNKFIIKYPNDIYICEKKISGVIAHYTSVDCVLSVGININTAPSNAICLNDLLHRDIDVITFFFKWMHRYCKIIDKVR